MAPGAVILGLILLAFLGLFVAIQNRAPVWVPILITAAAATALMLAVVGLAFGPAVFAGR